MNENEPQFNTTCGQK